MLTPTRLSSGWVVREAQSPLAVLDDNVDYLPPVTRLLAGIGLELHGHLDAIRVHMGKLSPLSLCRRFLIWRNQRCKRWFHKIRKKSEGDNVSENRPFVNGSMFDITRKKKGSRPPTLRGEGGGSLTLS